MLLTLTCLFEYLSIDLNTQIYAITIKYAKIKF